MIRYLAFGVVLALAACGDDDHSRPCTTSADCDQGGIPGTCRPSPESSQKWCSYPDTSCPTPPAQRWGALAGDGLAQTCVAQETYDGGVDGQADAPVFDAPVDAATDARAPDAGIDGGTPGPDLARRFGGVNQDQGNAVAVDGSGNILVTGFVRSSVDFGGGMLPFAGMTDAFTVKFSQAMGSHVWSKGFSSTGSESGAGIVADTTGNAVVTGGFEGSVDLGAGSLTSAGSADIYLAKYGAGGAAAWTKRFGGTGGDAGAAVALSPMGDVYLVGTMIGTVDFGGGNLVGAGSSDIFVAKFAGSDGGYLWARRYGGTGLDFPRAVTVDGAGNIYVTGVFNDTVDFGGGNLTSAGGYAVFVAKYAGATGAYQWARSYGGAAGATANAIAVDGSGGVAVAGSFFGTASFGGGDITAMAGFSDGFVAMYSGTDGSHVWSKQIGSGGGTDAAWGLALNPTDGNVVVAGTFAGAVDFGGGPRTSAGSGDVFVAEYTSAAGAHVWSRRFGGAGLDEALAVAVDGTGSVVITGDFQGMADFGTGVLTSAGGADILLLRFTP